MAGKVPKVGRVNDENFFFFHSSGNQGPMELVSDEASLLASTCFSLSLMWSSVCVCGYIRMSSYTQSWAEEMLSQ